MFLVTRGAPRRNQGRQGEEGVDIEACKLTFTHTYVSLHETREQVCKQTRTRTHTALPPSNPSDVACSISVRRRQTRANGHTVETGHDGVLTVVPRIVIGTPDGGKTRHRGGKGGGLGLKIQREEKEGKTGGEKEGEVHEDR